MKNKFLRLVSVAGLMAFLPGCLTRQPVVSETAVIDPTTLKTNIVFTTNIVYMADTNRINQAVDTVRAVNSATAVVDPYSAPIDWGLGIVGGLVTLGSTILAGVKNKKANTLQTIIGAVVQGVESGTAGLPSGQSSVKAAIQQRATAAGVQPQLDAIVQNAT